MFCRICFRNADGCRSWLLNGAPMPQGCEFRWFEYRVGTRHPIAARGSHWQELCENLRGDLQAENFWAYIFKTRGESVELQFYFHEDADWPQLTRDDQGQVLCDFEEVLRHFAQFDVSYGSVFDYQELCHRNLFKYDYWGNGLFSTCMIGEDISRYVPGLYWMNYLSRGFQKERKVDLRSAIELANCVDEDERGVILKMFDHPFDWEQHTKSIDDVLAESQSFFSMRNVANPPDNLSLAEYSRFQRSISIDWP